LGPHLVVVTGVQGTGKSTVADAAAEVLGSSVLSHDWAMSGLRPYPQLQAALDAMDPPGHGPVGWSVLFALARAELRWGRSVVVDGVARRREMALARKLAAEEGASMLVIETTCTDPGLHRRRIDGRTRAIPDWYELEWDDVERSRARWEALDDADLVLDAAQPWVENHVLLQALLSSKGLWQQSVTTDVGIQLPGSPP
jgi:predicted kinase